MIPARLPLHPRIRLRQGGKATPLLAHTTVAGIVVLTFSDPVYMTGKRSSVTRIILGITAICVQAGRTRRFVTLAKPHIPDLRILGNEEPANAARMVSDILLSDMATNAYGPHLRMVKTIARNLKHNNL